MWHFQISTIRKLFLTGLAGLFIFFYLWSSVPILDNREIEINRQNAIQQATDFLGKMNSNITDFKVEYGYFTDDMIRWHLANFLPHKEVREKITDSYLVDEHWHIRFTEDLPKNAPQESYNVLLTPNGKLKTWIHRIPDDAPGVELSEIAAIDLAQQFMKLKGITNLNQCKREVSSTRKKYRTDHFIKWTKNDSLLNGEWRYSITIRGDKIEGFSRGFTIPPIINKQFEESINFKHGLVDFVTPIYMLIFIWLIVEFTKLYQAGEIGQKNGLYLLFFCFLVLFGSTMNGLVETAFGWIVNVKTRTQIQLYVMTETIFTRDIILCMLVYFAYLVGESLTRANNRNKNQGAASSRLLSSEAIFKSGWQNTNVARSMSQGFWCGTSMLGLITLLMLLFTKGFNAVPGQNLFVDSIDQTFPWLAPIFKGLSFTLTKTIVLLFSLTALFQKYFKKPILSVLPFLLVLLTTGVAGITFFPHYYNVFIEIIFGISFGYIFFKYDLLTTLVASFVFVTLMHSLPLLNTNNQFLVISGFSATIVGMTPLFISFLGFKSNRSFQIREVELPSYIKRITERERMAKELEIARNIQLKLLPQNAPQSPVFDISGMCLPAQAVGGDYFEFTTLSNHQYGIGIGDVSGKGVPAAIYMTLTKGIFLSYSEAVISPKQVLSKVNRMLFKIMEKGHFVSMFYGVLDTEEMSLTYARAGHNPGIWYHEQHSEFRLLEPAGMALGLECGDVFDKVLYEEKIDLVTGDTLAFYTDGFTEAMNNQGDEFGEERLTSLLQQNTHLSASYAIQNVMSEIQAFVQNKIQHDDMTMVVVKMV